MRRAGDVAIAVGLANEAGRERSAVIANKMLGFIMRARSIYNEMVSSTNLEHVEGKVQLTMSWQQMGRACRSYRTCPVE